MQRVNVVMLNYANKSQCSKLGQVDIVWDGEKGG